MLVAAPTGSGKTLAAVMSNEIWEEIYDRLAALIARHRTTLVFVNTRRMAERVARHLSERLDTAGGAPAIAAHLGLLREVRRRAASLELASLSTADPPRRPIKRAGDCTTLIEQVEQHVP